MASDGDYTLRANAADLRAVVSAVGQGAFIVGASLGGQTGLTYAATDGPMRGLVLVDVAPQIEPSGAKRIGAFMRGAPNGFASIDEAAEAVSAYLPHCPRPKDTSGLMKNLRLKDDGRYHWHWDPQLLTGRGPTDVEQLRGAAAKLTVPTVREGFEPSLRFGPRRV